MLLRLLIKLFLTDSSVRTHCGGVENSAAVYLRSMLLKLMVCQLI